MNKKLRKKKISDGIILKSPIYNVTETSDTTKASSSSTTG